MLVLRLKDGDSISLKLEDGRVIIISLEVASRFRTNAFVEAPKSIRIDRIISKKNLINKEDNDRARDPSG